MVLGVDGIADFNALHWRRHDDEVEHPRSMALYLRKVVHPQAHDNYRVILKLDEGDVEIKSVGNPARGRVALEIDTVIPMRVMQTLGKASTAGLHETVQGCLGAVWRRRGH